MSGKDYTYWGCSTSNNRCAYGVKFRNPTLTYTYKVSDDMVVGRLSAEDAEGNDLTFSINKDDSGLFAIRGNQLILLGGSDLSKQGAQIQLTVDVTDSNGVTSALPLSLDLSDNNGIASQITQQLSGDEDSAFSYNADFGAGQTVVADSLPSWMTLQDLANGKVQLSGTPPESGEVSFAVQTTKDGKTTTFLLSADRR